MSISLDGSLRNTLMYIMEGIFNGAKNEPLKGHPLATLIRNDFKEVLCSVVQREDQNLKVEASAGQGGWATVVWGAILDPLITSKTSCGYFVVYHFHPSGEKVFLSICQGAKCVVDEYGNKEGLVVLRGRAGLARRRLADLLPEKFVDSISFNSSHPLPVRYEAGFITGVEYSLEALPSDIELRADLLMLCKLYRTLNFRGGLLPSLSDDAGLFEDEAAHDFSLNEQRQYSLHRRIDRNQALVKLVKEMKGCRCECCGMTFKEVYGDLGANYIEAHHLTPISELAEGVTVKQDPQKDFAVLCANCHRMIHRMDDPSGLETLRTLLGAGLK